MNSNGFRLISLLLISILYTTSLSAQPVRLQTKYATVTIDGKGFITSVRNKKNGREYCPKGLTSALMSLYAGKQYLLPQQAVYNPRQHEMRLRYPNGSEALVRIDQQPEYLKLKLLSLTNRENVDNIVWGPYKSTISTLIGDVIGVIRNKEFAFGMLGLDDNTTGGPPSEGDLSFMYYFIHSPDPVKYPLPAHLKEGQTFSIGGDGVNDVAFYSQPEEYFRMNYGNGAKLEPAYGATICMHSRNRRKEQMIRFPDYPDGLDGKANSARYQLVTPVEADFIGSAIALYACPDSLGLHTIEKIVLAEGLPYPTIDGKWIKDPSAYCPDIAWYGPHDSLVAYAGRLGIKGVQDEGWGEYYPNPANPWKNKKVSFSDKTGMSIPAFGALMKQHGIRYGLHTLCEFLQPGDNSDVSPIPSDSLAIMQRTTITKDLQPEDTIITVADTAYFNEFGGWEGNHTNVLKIGKELIEYDGITRTPPYTFLHVKRGFHRTTRGSYKAGTTIVKLQPNCYRGFAPDMHLQDTYADYYGKWLTAGGMDYIDFDGLESCMYQGHGHYSFKRFFRGLFDSYHRNGGKYLRVMGSAVQEGSWHYMSVCNVGGGDHMFSPVKNKWGIEGKDMRYVFESSYFPATFGIQGYQADWSLYDAENLEAKSIGWNATYMLGLNQQTVEASGEKEAIFNAFRCWEEARAANKFSNALKEKLKDLGYKFHLEKAAANIYLLYPIRENRFSEQRCSITGTHISLQNEFAEQPLEFSFRIMGPKGTEVKGVTIGLSDNTVLTIDKPLRAGQHVIYKKGKLCVADHGRKPLELLPAKEDLRIKKGVSDMVVTVLHPVQDDKVRFEVVVPVMGAPVKF
ncbi:hypothetical protein SAMN04488128_104284 [Chitinophaga eiseniae]|uniref:Uncharacterized protein n=1 Tax=Chitinophaga eiseniae TaxID=634771 RepID=A0A1T4TAM4_9BACT|nr:hypothetical protein [Chitinophaga eiseniae]SKA37436.1 hypothetical protein SAMN04488128_104284 [Chitinophaga eiseniae]